MRGLPFAALNSGFRMVLQCEPKDNPAFGWGAILPDTNFLPFCWRSFLQNRSNKKSALFPIIPGGLGYKVSVSLGALNFQVKIPGDLSIRQTALKEIARAWMPANSLAWIFVSLDMDQALHKNLRAHTFEWSKS